MPQVNDRSGHIHDDAFSSLGVYTCSLNRERMEHGMKIVSTTWTELPEGFTATTMAATDTHVIVGGEEGVRYKADLGSEPLAFIPIMFPKGLTYNKDWEVPIDEMEVDLAQTDWSTSTPQLAMNLREYQGGSYGLWIHRDGHDPDGGELFPTPRDSDIGFAQHYVLRGDVIITESYQVLYHLRYIDGEWVTRLIALPTTSKDFEIFDLALSHDGQTLVMVTFCDEMRTALFELREGRFVYTRTVDIWSSYVTCHATHMLTLDYQTPRLSIWDGPMWGPGVTSREVELPDDFQSFCGNDEFIGVVAGTTLELRRCDDLTCVVRIDLPTKAHNYAPTIVAFVDERMVILSQHQIGVITFDRPVPPSKPAPLTDSPAPMSGYTRARQVFAQFEGYDVAVNARQILAQLDQIPQVKDTHETSCWWLWRGYREGHVALCSQFSYTLSQNPDAYEVNDVFAFLEAIDHHDINALAHSHRMIMAKFRGNEASFVMYWAGSRGELRAGLGYELATRRLLPVQALPARSLERATYNLACCHLCGPRDSSYSSQLTTLRKLYDDAQIARGVIRAALEEEYLGMQITQWFELVWPHARPAERVGLLFKTSRAELVLWYATRFARYGLSDSTREQMESKLTELLVIEPDPNVFLPSTRPYEKYTFLTSAILLGQDAARRRVGLGPVGGMAFARALEFSTLFPNMCELTPELEALVRDIFGSA